MPSTLLSIYQLISWSWLQDGYAVVASDGPGEYPVIAESRAGSDGIGVSVTPGTVAYVTTGGDSCFYACLAFNYCQFKNLDDIYVFVSYDNLKYMSL